MHVTHYGGAADADGTKGNGLDTSDTTAEHLVSLQRRHDGLAES